MTFASSSTRALARCNAPMLAGMVLASCALPGAALAAQVEAESQNEPLAEQAALAETYGPPESTVVDTGAAVAPEGLPQSLLDAVEQSLAQNPRVLAELAELAALNSDLRVARWQRFPNLSAEVLAATGGSNVADADGFAVNVALEQPIWSGGGIGAQIDAARISRDVGQSVIREVRYDILLAVVAAYYEALLSFERVQALEAGISDMRTLVVSIERRVAQQVSPLADLTLAESRLVQLEVEITSARELGENALLRLEQLVGVNIDPPIFPQEAMYNAVPHEMIALDEMLACSPTMERRRGEIDLAEARVDQVRSGLLPQLLVQLSQSELTGARAALVLRLQTGNGLSQFAATDSAKARVDRAIAELGEADRDARARLRTEYVALRSNLQREDAALLAVDAADALLASYRRQFVAGRRSWLDVLNAAREKVNANVTHSDARVSAANSATRILALSCRWRPEGI